MKKLTWAVTARIVAMLVLAIVATLGLTGCGQQETHATQVTIATPRPTPAPEPPPLTPEQQLFRLVTNQVVNYFVIQDVFRRDLAALKTRVPDDYLRRKAQVDLLVGMDWGTFTNHLTVVRGHVPQFDRYFLGDKANMFIADVLLHGNGLADFRKFQAALALSYRDRGTEEQPLHGAEARDLASFEFINSNFAKHRMPETALMLAWSLKGREELSAPAPGEYFPGGIHWPSHELDAQAFEQFMAAIGYKGKADLAVAQERVAAKGIRFERNMNPVHRAAVYALALLDKDEGLTLPLGFVGYLSEFNRRGVQAGNAETDLRELAMQIHRGSVVEQMHPELIGAVRMAVLTGTPPPQQRLIYIPERVVPAQYIVASYPTNGR